LKIKLSFLGGAGNVTGSCFLLEAEGKRYLVDCGMFQERAFTNRNWAPFPVPPNTIDAVLLTHAHVDHCGLLPKLVHDGFNGKIYCTEATADIVQIILLDAAHLQEEDAAFKRKRHQREGRKGPYPEIPLYTTEDAEATFPLFSTTKYQQPVEIDNDVSAVFRDAGHVLGSSMIKVTIGKGGDARSIIFSGDVGRRDRPMLKDPKAFHTTDYVLVESTYGDREHEDITDTNDRLAAVVNETIHAGGNIIIPSFALQRSQEILYRMNELLMASRIPHLPVYLDSPMAVRITEVFQRYRELFDKEMLKMMDHRNSPFEFPGLQMSRSTEESKAINFAKGSVMVIAGAGMCNGGRIKHHLVNNIMRPENTILFAGYQAIGTLGRTIVDGAEEVRILGQKYPVVARIEQIRGFSSHADRNDLMQMLSELTEDPKKVFVVHGEERAAESFAKMLHEEKGWNVVVPKYRETVELD
jgi:metallo-beta-lactamase family protein